MHHFLVFFTAVSFTSPWWQHAHFLLIFVTAFSFTSPWWHAPLFGFCHRCVIYKPMVSACTTCWTFLSLPCHLQAHGDSMHHFLDIFVTAVSFTRPWWHAPLFVFSHSGVIYKPMVIAGTTLWSFLPPCWPLAAHGDIHYFLFFVTTVSFTSPWWHAPLFGVFHSGVIYKPMVAACPLFAHFCHRLFIYKPMVTCTTFWFLLPMCHLHAHGDSRHHF